MNKMIAYCGLNCEECDAYIATKNNDEQLRIETSKLWSQLNQVEITPDMIQCTGCRMEGVKTPYCGFICAIRKCGMEKKLETCGQCSRMSDCEKLSPIITNNPGILTSLK